MSILLFQVTVTQADDPSKDWEGRLSPYQLFQEYPWIKAAVGDQINYLENIDITIDQTRFQLQRVEEPEDPGRSEIHNNPVASHHPDCQCERCQIGDDQWLWLHHPGEY
jgi:hypothetical protein